MLDKLTRRDFISTAAVAGAALSMGGFSAANEAKDQATKPRAFATRLYPSTGCKLANVRETAEMAAKCGYKGLEIWDWDVDIAKAVEARSIAEANGLRIHSVVRAWTSVNNPDSFANDVQTVKKALKVARAYGSDAILWVPCRVNAPAIKPENFKIEFDPASCKVSKVVEGDNAPYADYIKLQNEASDATEKAIEQLVSTAAYEGVTLALENVWNQLWVMPNLAAAYIKKFDNLWIKSYFDLGNNCKYAATEEWLKALGKSTIAKLHIKDFAIERNAANGGTFVPIGYGSINWVSVRNTLEEIGYNGWVTLEDVGHYSPAEHMKILEGFFNGDLTKKFAENIKKFG